jgi:hypothetical protein
MDETDPLGQELPLKTVFADFNAVTESGCLRLNCRGSRDDLRDSGIKVGDWMWLNDGEVQVLAVLVSDDRDGVVGLPLWSSLVHLDDDDSKRIPS